MNRQKQKVLTFILLIIFIVLNSSSALANASFAFETTPSGDAYHTWFQQQLQNEYGLTNGQWIFTDSEHANLSNLWSQAATQLIPVTGMPFSQALRVTVSERVNLPWEIGLGMPTNGPITAGDKIVVSFWAKNNWAEKDGGYIRTTFQDLDSYQQIVMYPALPNSEWQQYFMATTVTESFPGGTAGLYFMIGTQLQEFEIGGVTAVNLGPAVSEAALPQSPLGNYAGQEPDAPWRAEAAERIEQLRRGDLVVTAVDSLGNPIPNANVNVIMRSHAFDLGPAIRAAQILNNHPDDQTYRQKLVDLDGRGNGFNLGVIEYALQWEPWEREIDIGYSQEQIISAVDWLREQDMALRGHSLIWPRWSSLPDDIIANQHNPDYVRQRMNNRIAEALTHPGLAGKFEEWDVLNEPRFNTDIASIFAGQPGYTTGEEIYAELYNKAAEIDPNVKLALNEYNVLNEAGMFIGVQQHMHQILTSLDNNGAKLDRIGLQTHMAYPFTPPERVYELLDEFAVYDKELRITEFEILIEDEMKAGQYMHDFLTILYSHPAATGIVLWNFWDGSHWDSNAPLFRQDWSLKPSGSAFIDLVYNQWWTDEAGTTDAAGNFSVRGYTGDYLIQVIGPDGLAKTEMITLDNTGAQVTVVVDQQRLFLPVMKQ